MRDNTSKIHPDNVPPKGWREKVRKFIKNAKTLQGDPHYISTGIAIGFFVGLTPTIPFHTAISIMFAFIFKASKPGAVLGAWLSGNPFTIVPFWVGSCIIGIYLIGDTTTFNYDYTIIQELFLDGWSLLHLSLDMFIATMLGSVILGIVPTIAAYIISRNIFLKIRARKTSKEISD